MPAAQREGLAEAAGAVAGLLQAGDVFQVRAAYASGIPVDASNDAVVRTLAGHLNHATLRVAQVYLLDASGLKAGTATADFSCALAGSTSETDFSIANLPTGVYGFAMVEAAGGGQPWVLTLLLQQQGGGWKLAGFSSHARTVAGHDGLWYWTAARGRADAKQPWAATVLYNEAFALLQPAAYVSSTHLDKLSTELRNAAPPELQNGVSAETPYVLTAKAGGEFRFTDISAAGSDDGARLLLVLHYSPAAPAGAATALPDGAAGRARNVAAAAAFLGAHPEVRPVVQGVTVFADVAGGLPFATQHAVGEIP